MAEMLTLSSVGRMSKNFETYALVWLDANVHKTQENIDAQPILRSCINHLQLFDDSMECEQYVRSTMKEERIVLITSGRLSQCLIPQIHDLEQIYAIYVYCIDQAKYEGWSAEFSKVRGVFVRLEQLIRKIKEDQSQRDLYKAIEPISISILKNRHGKERSSIELNGCFVHAQVLVDVLKRLPMEPADEVEFIQMCRTAYEKNKTELSIIDEYEQSYCSDRALWWYTRQSFLYRWLNKALRVQDIQTLFLLRFLIRDIEKQLIKYQSISSQRVYRGQWVSADELEVLKVSKDTYISMNSFLSTSMNRTIAEQFLESSRNHNEKLLKPVLFEIDLDTNVVGAKPFADITDHSYFPGEKEILIMLGAIFRLVDVHLEKDNIWIIRIVLCGDEENSLKLLLEQMKHEFGQSNMKTNLLSLGKLLCNMGKYDNALFYLYRMLNQRSSDHDDRARCYSLIGEVKKKQHNLDESLDWYLKALVIRKRKSSADIELAENYRSIGDVHRKRGSLDEAKESYEKSLSTLKKCVNDDHEEIAKCLVSVGFVHTRLKEHRQALSCYNDALIINEKVYPENHYYFVSIHSGIAHAQRCLRNHDAAMKHIQIAHDIMGKSLPDDHYLVAWVFEIFGNIYEDLNQLENALSYYHKAELVYRKTLPENHFYIVEIKKAIDRVTI